MDQADEPSLQTRARPRRLARTLADTFPQLAREWHPTKNGELRPEEVAPKSIRRVWWRCSKDPDHEWCTGIGNRTAGKGCPYCSGRLATRETSLAALEPSVAREWHPTRNGSLSPWEVRPVSGQRVWWRCRMGHEWQTTIAARAIGSGCPYCSGKRATAETSLAALHPELAREWHPTRNGKRTAAQLRPGSGQRVWWQCSEGHEWQALIASRTQGKGCPFCAGNRVSADMSLAAKRPDIAREWHRAKNRSLTPHDVTPGSGKVVWWRCAIHDCEWRAKVQKRTGEGQRCPMCSGFRAGPETSLAARYPKIARQWHPSRNRSLTPDQVLAASRKSVWWQCGHVAGHVWQARIDQRTLLGSDCPYCHDEARRRKHPRKRKAKRARVSLVLR
jgi:hypothetical protein